MRMRQADVVRPDPLPVVVTVNLEPDDRVTSNDGTDPWDGVEGTIALVEEWRAGRSDMAVGWYWRCDPAIEAGYGDAAWALRRWRGQIEQALERGDEVGTHPHYWRWSDELGTFVSDAADDEWKTHCIRSSVDTMRATVGAPARVIMIGDGYVDAASARAIDELGIEVDLTLEPGGAARERMLDTEHTTGTMPDRSCTPPTPFRPSRHDPLRPGRVRLRRHWALPITTTTTPVVHEGTIVDPVGIPANLGLDPWRFRHIVTSGVAASEAAGTPYVHVVVRSDVGSNAGLAQHTAENLHWLLGGMTGLADRYGGVAFVTPHEALRRLGRLR